MDNRILEWLSIPSNANENAGNSAAVHVDEFISIDSLSGAELLLLSIDLFDQFVAIFNDMRKKELSLYLSIGLNEYNSILTGAPANFREL